VARNKVYKLCNVTNLLTFCSSKISVQLTVMNVVCGAAFCSSDIAS
jgi:hypothetical protein